MTDLDSAKFIDITPVISKRSAVFPGDTKFSRHVDLDFEKGDNLTLSHIQTTVHIGAHADAPNHYHSAGIGIEKRDLSIYMGSVQVIEVNLPEADRIKPEHFSDTKIESKRVLFKTNSFNDPDTWKDEFNSLSPDTITLLADAGVILVGIDTPSVDPADDKELLTHSEIYRRDMAILEGIILKDVEAGNYQLIALPLPIEGADASPVRAILVKE